MISYRRLEEGKPTVGISKNRRSRIDFLAIGLDVLADHGHEGLTGTKVARELNVTTGSFYWHFECVQEFRKALRQYWRNEIVIGI